jgi:hypothetical protein
MTVNRLASALAAIAAFALITAPAHRVGAEPKQPAYVGTWASKPAQCKIDQSMEGAPLIMRRDGYDQHEAHCTFSNIQAKGSTWTLRATCSVEGDKQTIPLTLSVAKDRLTIGDKFGKRVLQRCP